MIRAVVLLPAGESCTNNLLVVVLVLLLLLLASSCFLYHMYCPVLHHVIPVTDSLLGQT